MVRDAAADDRVKRHERSLMRARKAGPFRLTVRIPQIDQLAHVVTSTQRLYGSVVWLPIKPAVRASKTANMQSPSPQKR